MFYNHFTTDPSDSYLAYADAEGMVHVREPATERSPAEFPAHIGWPDLSQFRMDYEALFTPDAQRPIPAGSGQFVKVWDWRNDGVMGLILRGAGAAVL